MRSIKSEEEINPRKAFHFCTTRNFLYPDSFSGHCFFVLEKIISINYAHFPYSVPHMYRYMYPFHPYYPLGVITRFAWFWGGSHAEKKKSSDEKKKKSLFFFFPHIFDPIVFLFPDQWPTHPRVGGPGKKKKQVPFGLWWFLMKYWINFLTQHETFLSKYGGYLQFTFLLVQFTILSMNMDEFICSTNNS